jgi:hypothetical protein
MTTLEQNAEVQARYDRFAAVLADQYAQLFESDPDTYAMAKARYSPTELARKMTNGLASNTANKDGEGIKRTCKALGIAYTYKAIRAYLGN